MDKFKFIKKDRIERLPKKAGVYCFKGEPFNATQGKLLYIGKAVNIRERVKNHFNQPTIRDNFFISQVSKIGYIETNSEIEALILEANFIKRYQPRFNVVWRDDKNYFYVAVAKEEFPKIFITHQPITESRIWNKEYRIKNSKLIIQNSKFQYVGPFVDGKPLKQTLNALQRSFPWRACPVGQKKPCFWQQLGRCCGPCTLSSNTAKQLPHFRLEVAKTCQNNVKAVLKILRGDKNQVLTDLKKEMRNASKAESFEAAAKIRDKIYSLERVLANAKVLGNHLEAQPDWEKTEKILQKISGSKNGISRIEAYDISNIQGKEATGSMVTFIKSVPDKNLYRKFRIRIAGKPNDVAMIKELLSRRLNHPDWGLPDLILVDGGSAQLGAAKSAMKQFNNLAIPAIALAKRNNELYTENRRKPIPLKVLPKEIFNLILYLRDEAHRFAISYHKKIRKVDFLPAS